MIGEPEGVIPTDQSHLLGLTTHLTPIPGNLTFLSMGMDFMDEDADPDLDESLQEDELNGGW